MKNNNFFQIFFLYLLKAVIRLCPEARKKRRKGGKEGEKEELVGISCLISYALVVKEW